MGIKEKLSGGEEVLKQLEKNSLRRLAFEQSERRRPPEREIRGGIEDFVFRSFLTKDQK